MPELAKIAWTSDECALGPDPGGAASDALLSQAVSVTRSSLSDAHNRRGNLHANSYQNPAMQLQPVCLLCGASSGENNEAVLPFLPFRLRGDEISLGPGPSNDRGGRGVVFACMQLLAEAAAQ